LQHLLPDNILSLLQDSELSYLTSVFKAHQGYPTLEQLWQLMDEPWKALQCDPLQMDERITAYYNHPVWLLNGLFIEQDPESLAHRHAFTSWVKAQSPLRVADFGGGFGTLARFIGAALPNAEVEVIEPHPHLAATKLCAESTNVRFVPELTGSYDMLIATDVFEHVADPISLAFSTASHLRIGGHYLIANCFAPVIQCHLPQLFHLQIGWDQMMRAMGLQPQERVRYGRSFQRMGRLDEPAARSVEVLAKRIYPVIKLLPKGHAQIGRSVMRLLSVHSCR
jgi:hypothetical protein